MMYSIGQLTSKKATENGEDGLTTYNNMSAAWAFAGLQTDQQRQHRCCTI